MKPYKALQNKAFHNGMYIAYATAKGKTWTTNGHIMVAKEIDTDELKPLKDQYEQRGIVVPKDLTGMIDKVSNLEASRVTDGVDWTNAAGLKVNEARGGEYKLSVQQVYVDYVNALFNDSVWWYITERVLYATLPGTAGAPIVAIVAPVRELPGDKVNEEGDK